MVPVMSNNATVQFLPPGIAKAVNSASRTRIKTTSDRPDDSHKTIFAGRSSDTGTIDINLRIGLGEFDSNDWAGISKFPVLFGKCLVSRNQTCFVSPSNEDNYDNRRSHQEHQSML